MQGYDIGIAIVAASLSAETLERIRSKPRRKGRILSDSPFGPPSPFETRQQRRYRERMEAKKLLQAKEASDE